MTDRPNFLSKMQIVKNGFRVMERPWPNTNALSGVEDFRGKRRFEKRPFPRTPNTGDLRLLYSVRLPCPSFRRKTESSLFTSLLDPGFRRADDRTHGLVLKSQALPRTPIPKNF